MFQHATRSFLLILFHYFHFLISDIGLYNLPVFENPPQSNPGTVSLDDPAIINAIGSYFTIFPTPLRSTGGNNTLIILVFSHIANHPPFRHKFLENSLFILIRDSITYGIPDRLCLKGRAITFRYFRQILLTIRNSHHCHKSNPQQAFFTNHRNSLHFHHNLRHKPHKNNCHHFEGNPFDSPPSYTHNHIP